MTPARLLFLTVNLLALAAMPARAATNVPISALPSAATIAEHDALALYQWTGSNYAARQLSGTNFQAALTNAARGAAQNATNTLHAEALTGTLADARLSSIVVTQGVSAFIIGTGSNAVTLHTDGGNLESDSDWLVNDLTATRIITPALVLNGESRTSWPAGGGTSGVFTASSPLSIAGTNISIANIPTNLIDSTFFNWINGKGEGSGTYDYTALSNRPPTGVTNGESGVTLTGNFTGDFAGGALTIAENVATTNDLQCKWGIFRWAPGEFYNTYTNTTPTNYLANKTSFSGYSYALFEVNEDNELARNIVTNTPLGTYSGAYSCTVTNAQPYPGARVDSSGFHGNGAGLTNLMAANLTPGGTLPALNAAALTNTPFAALNFSGLVTAAFTSTVCGYLKFTNAGTIYSIVVSTNLP